MASPQKENGYTSVANELLEAFAQTHSIGSEAFQVLMLLIRRSYGFHRKDAEMSISFIAKGTGLKRRCASRAVERLVSKRMIVRTESIVSLNKNYDEWVVSKRTPSVQTDTPPVSKRRTEVVSKRTPNKERLKETPERKILPADKSAGDEDQINLIFSVFYDTINQHINFGQKSWRQATADLIKAHGFDVVLKLTKYACRIQGEEYAPVITNPYQLKQKLAQLQIFIKKSQQPQKGTIQTL